MYLYKLIGTIGFLLQTTCRYNTAALLTNKATSEFKPPPGHITDKDINESPVPKRSRTLVERMGVLTCISWFKFRRRAPSLFRVTTTKLFFRSFT